MYLAEHAYLFNTYIGSLKGKSQRDDIAETDPICRYITQKKIKRNLIDVIYSIHIHLSIIEISMSKLAAYIIENNGRYCMKRTSWLCLGCDKHFLNE